MYRQRNPPQEPPCTRCRVDLEEANETDAHVYMLSRRQVVTVGMGQIADISIPAIKIVMDLCGIRNQLQTLNRVRKVFYHFQGGKADES